MMGPGTCHTKHAHKHTNRTQVDTGRERARGYRRKDGGKGCRTSTLQLFRPLLAESKITCRLKLASFFLPEFLVMRVLQHQNMLCNLCYIFTKNVYLTPLSACLLPKKKKTLLMIQLTLCFLIQPFFLGPVLMWDIECLTVCLHLDEGWRNVNTQR